MTDTLLVDMSARTLTHINTLANDFIIKPSNSNGTYITVCGMLLVSIISLIGQYIIMKGYIKRDKEKQGLQVISDFNVKLTHEWISDFRKIIAELITTTDPDYNGGLDKTKMMLLISQAQIMLDNSITVELELSVLITQLGMTADYLRTDDEEAVKLAILQSQDIVVKQAQKVLKYKHNKLTLNPNLYHR